MHVSDMPCLKVERIIAYVSRKMVSIIIANPWNLQQPLLKNRNGHNERRHNIN